ncbi:TetR/AcrR family transcriptional regulator [Pseudosulfitobacter pseudonitzschiae]|uniref:TetR/AcrR family transcriptional regulator n=1 Tax=Pseudosulfitobacter pseudonitzschiae TaxID=1402135 RepID=UPI001AFAAFA8|nr:TetR/AcrR family transcriptional regulator [Pseudosulfitobacter pseudonitzschiae]MBM1814189.1 TetR/AcrR family transcriptional regulator [Pseudosulfitobacter pseudonitzschiae]MBM1831182.1 TetR/AcrR family transcriptional regulator [Pseudosulfitobacter pseudonitzschiae]MBM1836049.1 TetR/AcrR family transcriptional regulator [Pseudosulfitobacter pseudonitzschiae]MBM1840895.1 TetR/AcrR family transcriptional regulator [Pseudosulfitobacter pseudonitzschiae]MBM1845117.1 TetR/AcrR family transcri
MTKIDKIERLSQQADAKSAKRARKKQELADHAITALKQLGYARTSLRDIAAMSGVAVGTLHYYFEDKVDLIGFCVRRYKVGFVAQMDDIVRTGDAPDALLARFIKRLALSIRRDAETHRLWYDVRSQAMFDPAFEEVVFEIEAAMIALVVRLLDRLGQPADQARAQALYLILDAAFRFHLQRYLAGDKDAPSAFETQVSAQFGTVV